MVATVADTENNPLPRYRDYLLKLVPWRDHKTEE